MSTDKKVKRINLIQTNTSSIPIPVTWSGLGFTPQTFSPKACYVVKFSIPNDLTPLMLFKENTFSFAMSYLGTTKSVFLTGVGVITKGMIVQMDDLVVIMNNALVACTVGLNALIALPGGAAANIPVIYYNQTTSQFILCAQTSTFNQANTILGVPIVANPVYLYCNLALQRVLESIPVSINSTIGPNWYLFRMIATLANVWSLSSTYNAYPQESTSLDNFASPQYLVVTTSLPIESEIFLSNLNSTTSPSGYTTGNILSNYTFDYNNGAIEQNETLVYTAITSDFRLCAMTPQEIRDFSCNVFYVNNDGSQSQFFLSPGKTATLLLEFLL